jgi:competence protein ComEA
MTNKLLPVVLLILAATVTLSYAADEANGVVNINTASAEQLQLLPRIGPALSQRIIEFREANGPFKSTDELVAVKGIGERSIKPLKPYITIKGETTLKSKVRLSLQAKKEG